ncbi:galactose-binding domain-like protein [Globomyces pollinis-pini]|nr:galactose-binding domain-like protein [Globomyces pollinis-pini]KAJ2996351.1 Heat shock protein beta-11 [Globomyces sp. JEL0801]
MVQQLENLASDTSGAIITASTSSHPDYPESNILDGQLKTFWITTGILPQEFILTFPQKTFIKKVIVSSRNVAEWVVYHTSDKKFELFAEQVLEDIDGIQTCVIEPVNGYEVLHLKFVILKAHDAFASIHRLVCYGDK